MWRLATLQLNQDTKEKLKQIQSGKAKQVNLSAAGTKLGVHNWTHGSKTKDGRYLSPQNAIKAIADKFVDKSDTNRPAGSVDVVGIMITTQNIDDFIAQLEQAAVLLPDPVFKQSYDYAKSQKDLATTKMIKTPTVGYPAFSPGADITPQSAQTLNGIMRNANAVAMAVRGDPSTLIKNLLQKKQQREAENKQKLDKLLSTKAQVYAFCETGELAQIALRLNSGAPSSEYIFTALIVYVGADLSNIRGMII